MIIFAVDLNPRMDNAMVVDSNIAAAIDEDDAESAGDDVVMDDGTETVAQVGTLVISSPVSCGSPLYQQLSLVV